MPGADERVLTVAQVAERLQLNEQTVRRWLRTGKLKGTLIGGTKAGYRVPESEVARILAGEMSPLAASAGDPEG
jgi:excisionase family DNA binding protein